MCTGALCADNDAMLGLTKQRRTAASALWFCAVPGPAISGPCGDGVSASAQQGLIRHLFSAQL
jgi:hypothetical protein